MVLRASLVAALALISLGPVGAASPAPSGAAPLMQWSDLLGRAKPAQKPERIRYGPAASQVVDLWRPATPGAHPVIAMIHGGCWTASVADLHIMDWAAADLARRGIAVWNIEYRRLGEPGAGYPGTYQDVGAALDKLKAEAPRLRLDLRRAVVVGHSAGGHLALWSAARKKLASTSPLHAAHPLRVTGVVDVAGIPNLETDTATACGPEAVAAMAGPATPARPNPFAYTSPAHLVPLGVRQIVIHGTGDHTVALAVGQAYAARAKAAGDRVEVRAPPGGHVEEIAPGTPAGEAVAAAIQELLR